jgi:hypothetical protein
MVYESRLATGTEDRLTAGSQRALSACRRTVTVMMLLFAAVGGGLAILLIWAIVCGCTKPRGSPLPIGARV